MTLSVKPGSRVSIRQLPLACCLFLLALSVFGWGLRSKVSLYDVSQVGQVSTPSAKLISEQDRPSSLKVQQSLRPAPSHVAVLFVALASFPLPTERVYADGQIAPVEPIAFSFDGPSLLRPPPYLVA